MKSDKARNLIANNTIDLHSNNRMDSTGYVSLAVSISKAYNAVGIAEEEMRQKAIEAHIKSCPKLAVGKFCCNNKFYVDMVKCDGGCHYVEQFKEYL